MKIYTVYLTKDGKWHSSEEVGSNLIGCWESSENHARKYASLLTGDKSKGTADFIGIAIVAYCIHAMNRCQALKLAKSAYQEHISRGMLVEIK